MAMLSTLKPAICIRRVISVGAGLPEDAPAFLVNRLCGSGLQAVVSATQLIQLGDAQAVLAGGVEVMSRAGYLSAGMRWGARLGHAEVTDMLLGALSDPFGLGHMGITAENVAADFEITRAEMDAFAAESQARAAKASENDWFTGQVEPVEVRVKRQILAFDRDEFIRLDTKS